MDRTGRPEQQARPWHADVVLFDAAGDVEQQWKFTWTAAQGGVWACMAEGSMPLDELVDALAYLHKMSPRMQRITWGEEWDHIHESPAPEWILEVEYDDYPPTPLGSLAAFVSMRLSAGWFFPDEVGYIACRYWQPTMDLLYWLCRNQWTQEALAVMRQEVRAG